jgi:hypothetical protein
MATKKPLTRIKAYQRFYHEKKLNPIKLIDTKLNQIIEGMRQSSRNALFSS